MEVNESPSPAVTIHQEILRPIKPENEYEKNYEWRGYDEKSGRIHQCRAPSRERYMSEQFAQVGARGINHLKVSLNLEFNGLADAGSENVSEIHAFHNCYRAIAPSLKYWIGLFVLSDITSNRK